MRILGTTAALALLHTAACGGGGGIAADLMGGADATPDAALPTWLEDGGGSAPPTADGETQPIDDGASTADGTGPSAPDDAASAGDAGAIDDPPDAPEPGEFGAACVEHEDCNSGYCIPHASGAGSPDGSFCSQLCQQECPEGYLCQHQPQLGVVVFLCVEVEEVGCVKPCFHPGTFQDCGVPGALCADVDGLLRCLERCDGPQDCPPDFSCTEMTDETGFPLGDQCYPDSGSCDCGTNINTAADPNNCGGCGVVCAYDHATPLCQAGDCAMGVCDAGQVDLNEDVVDGCEYACEVVEEAAPGYVDLPDDDLVDADCDGLDGEWQRAVFVTPDGVDSGNDDGAWDYPFGSINAAIEFADTFTPARMVLVAAGTYVGQIVLRDGVTVAGGYSPADWTHDPSKHKTVVIADSLEPSGAIRGVVGDGIVSLTRLSGMTVRTASNPAPGGSTQAMWLRNCGPALDVSGNRLEPGDGGAGLDGTSGADGLAGVDGAPGQTGGSENWWNPQITVLGGEGGEHLCDAGADTTGGPGGAAGWGDDPTFDGEKDAKAGQPSVAGAPGGPAGGTKENGETGGFGEDGQPGDDGAGGGADGTVDVAGNWWPAAGGGGTEGTNGGGAGGGGGGGGGMSTDGLICPFICEHAHGGGGGGGGSGGCGGTSATSGGGGGGAFGVVVVGGGPTLRDNQIVYGVGGAGGAAGKGGKGGSTGYGGAPGEGHGTAGTGGWGGKGGKGGRGGHGGGGGGGPSIGIYLTPGSQPSCDGNSFVGGPSPGTGGTSSGEAGASGVSGPVGPAASPSCSH